MTSSAAFHIDLHAVPVLSYALAHNGVPVVDDIRVRYVGGSELRNAELRLQVCDAQGVLSRPCTRRLDLAAGADTVVQDVDLRLDPSAMLQVEEARPGRLIATVEVNGTLVHEQSVDVRVLAARQWLAQPKELALEVLPAFVMPNDPAVGRLVDEAAALLRQGTGSPSIEGYQTGPERVDEIVSAVFTAAQAREIRYSEPPASWADAGQKIRTPHEVLDGRVGTCLDTAVVLAAALEQSGVHPLLWVVEGHAFLGYWRTESSLANIVHTEVADVVNYIDLGLIQLVETTLVTAREQRVPFADTHRRPYVEHLTGDLAKVQGVVDVFTARRNGVLPLPSRTREPSGEVQVVEYRPATHSTPPQRDRQPRPDEGSARSGAEVAPRITQWKNALLDLSLRNRLINFKESGAVTLTLPNGVIGAVEDRVHEGRLVHLVPSDAISGVHQARGVRTARDLPEEILTDFLTQDGVVFAEVTQAAYQTRMRNLAYKARTIVEETGANNLYLALGSLVWDWDGKELRSPLILVPVRLVTKGRQGGYRLELDESGTSTPNYCLLEKLKQLGIQIPGLAEPEDDGAGIDLDAALHAVRVAVAEAGQRWRVEATAHVAILQFAKFRLWKDLDEHWATLVENPLVHHLVRSPTDPFEDPAGDARVSADLDELAGECPVPADASQLEAVAAAVAGRSFVLEGPPGTGKSQTITNLLSRAVTQGRQVLFVAEKRAALDVVQKRLEAVGMGPFCLDLHDKGSKPAVVRAQVKAALDHRVAVDEQGLSAQQDDLRSSRRTLARYATRLHEENAAGLSLYSARDALLALGEGGPVLPVPAALVTSSTGDILADVRRTAERLPDVADPARPSPHHPWGFVGPVAPEELDVEAFRSSVATMDAAARDVPSSGPLAEALRSARTPSDLATLASLVDAPPLGLEVLDAARSTSWEQASSSLRQEIAAFVAAAHPGLDVATPAAMDLPLADLHAQAQAAAASGWFGRRKRLQAVLDQIAPALRSGATVKPKAVPQLTEALVQVQGAVRGLAGRATSVPGLTVPGGWTPLTEQGRQLVERQLTWLRWAGRAIDAAPRDAAGATFATTLRRWLETRTQTDVVTAGAVHRLAEAAKEVQRVAGAGDQDVSAWAEDVGLLERWAGNQDRRNLGDPQLLGLRRWAAFIHHLDPLRAAGMDEARHQLLTGRVAADDAVRALDRGIARSSLSERLADTGLDAFDPLAHERSITRFTSSSAAVRDLMTEELPRRVVDARPFSAETGRGQVGALQRELSKQRGGLGVRGLLGKYGDLITQLMPCVLVSPDSVARFFPARAGLFDLVVFDEASQIRVADAVGAMGRARSVVVVGDSKQMPPTSFAEVSLSDDEDQPAVDDGMLAVEDEESILSECVQARVPRTSLSWHYRSQDESLIAFSNRHYYDDRLSSFPAPTAGHHGFGVGLVRVDGTFHRSGKGKLLRTNPVEAQAVVDEIRRRFDTSPDGSVPSIGVVTFNQQQRAYIEALLRDSADDRLIEALDASDGLFVKNLENVQGDERDLILFSTAFSVNDKGVLPLNFGPLNRAGGERRLNVAVTRARRQVVVFSSFDPAQLRADETSSVGIKHLRAYLDLAASGGPDETPQGARLAARDRHREQIAVKLEECGLVVKRDVGLSEFRIDLTLARPDAPTRPVVAVLLDGPGWARRRTVRDRDGLPVEVLSTMLRWPAVERVWLPAWIAHPDEVLERLVHAVDASAERPASVAPPLPPVPPIPRPRPERHADEQPARHGVSALTPARASTVGATIRTPHVLPNETPFCPWSPTETQGREVLNALPAAWAVTAVRSAVEDVVRAEGPVHEARLAKLVASAFGLTRVSAGRASTILRTVPSAMRTDDREPFLWPVGLSPRQWQGFRRASEDSPRPLEEVSLVEIGSAMVALCISSAGMQREELLREALAVFGGRRLTPSIRARLDEALLAARHSQRLEDDGFGLISARAGLDV